MDSCHWVAVVGLETVYTDSKKQAGRDIWVPDPATTVTSVSHTSFFGHV